MNNVNAGARRLPVYCKGADKEMYKILTSSLVVAICAAAAHGTDLNLTIRACDGLGPTEVNVAPGADLPYVVVGVLGDGTTQGLATVGINLLVHDTSDAIAVDLPRADPPSGLPMSNFAYPDGLNNPTDGVLDSAEGYGGTPSRGKLLQACGAQNTILNNSGAFLTGTPMLNVAQPGSAEVLVAGTLTAPVAVGDYTLAIKATCVRIDPLQAALSSDTLCAVDADCPQGDPGSSDDEVCKGHPFAMLIDQEVGTPPDNFFSVVPATIPEPTHLTIHVVAGAPNPCSNCLDPSGAHDPPTGTIDAGIAHPVNDAGTNLMPGAVTLAFTDEAVRVVPGEILVDSGGTALTVVSVSPVSEGSNIAVVELSAPMTPGVWTIFTHCGANYCVGSMPGDAGQSGATTVDDIGALITCLNTGACHPAVCDIDRFSACTGADLATLVNLLNKAGTFTEVFSPLGPSPCVP